MKTCPVCGEENPDRARFCMACSSALTDDSLPEFRVRKIVTLLFCDITGSTSLGEKLDPESVGRVLAQYYEALKTVVERHGGTVAKFIGDAVLGVFGIPTLHEDDALRAVRAAAEIPHAIEALNERLGQGIDTIQVRIGVNTGEVVAGDPSIGDSLVTGDAVNVAARLEQAAHPGVPLIGHDTFELVRDAVEVDEIKHLEVRGKAEPVRAFTLRRVKPGVAGHERRMDSPMVGRRRQRDLLRHIFDGTRQDLSCHLFTLLGPAGVGKSRLVLELVNEVGHEATILQGRCLPYGDGITFWPVVEVLRQAAGAIDGDSPEVAMRKVRTFLYDGDEIVMPSGFSGSPDVLQPLSDIAGLVDSPTTNEQINWSIRKLFEELGKHRPLVVTFDDIHWAEPAFLNLLEHIADWSRASAILLLCMARQDLLDLRPDWGGGKYNATTILLEPLSEDESTTLVTQLLSSGDVPREVVERIVTSAEGNPLFLEEMLSMLIDDELLKRSDGRWVLSDPSKVTVPRSIHTLIAARLDRLDRKERILIERAAVIGKEFDLRSVANLMPEDSQIEVASCAMALVRKDLLRPSESDRTGESFRFRHLLIQNAAYLGIPKEIRADLHHRFADWLEHESTEAILEFEEIIGHHFEQAARYLQELAITDDRAEALSKRAAGRLGSAGVRAYARADSAAAENLLARAIELLPPHDTRRMELLPFLGAAKGDRSNLAGAEDAYREAIELGTRYGRDDVRWHGEIAIEHLRLATAPLGMDLDNVLRRAQDAIAALEESGNELAITLAWFLVVVASHRLGRFRAAGDAAGRALIHARSARQPRQEADACGLVMVSGLLGSLPLTEMVELAAKMLDQAGGNQMLELWATGELGIGEILLGREPEGRAKAIASRERLQELGLEFAVAAMDAMLGDCELALGNPEAADGLYRHALELLRKTGDEGGASAVAGALARACFRQGNIEEAEQYTVESEHGIPEGTLHFRSRWRAPRALLLAHRGEINEAKRVANEWQRYIDTTDALMHRGDAWMDLAEIFSVEGDLAAARRAAERAVELYTRKIDNCDRERARRFRAELPVT